jgi:hypothetical protein
MDHTLQSTIKIDSIEQKMRGIINTSIPEKLPMPTIAIPFRSANPGIIINNNVRNQSYICKGNHVMNVGGIIDRRALVGSNSHGIVGGQPKNNS